MVGGRASARGSPLMELWRLSRGGCVQVLVLVVAFSFFF